VRPKSREHNRSPSRPSNRTIEAEQSSSVAATDPGPSRRRTQAGAVEPQCSFWLEVVDRLDLSVERCTNFTFPIHMAQITHRRGRRPILLLTPAFTRLVLLFVSNAPECHLQHIAGFHSHTHPTYTAAGQEPKPPHANSGSGGTNLGRKNTGELLCLIKIRYSLGRRRATKGCTRQRRWVLML